MTLKYKGIRLDAYGKKINLYVLLLDTPEQGPLFQKVLRCKVIRTKCNRLIALLSFYIIKKGSAEK